VTEAHSIESVPSPHCEDLEKTAELLALLREITPTPWRVVRGATHLEIRGPHQQGVATVARVFCDLDARFIALAANLLPGLLAGVPPRHLAPEKRGGFQQFGPRESFSADSASAQLEAENARLRAALREIADEKHNSDWWLFAKNALEGKP
jgi:hypothetical protein